MSLDIGGTGPVTALGPDFLQLASGSVPAGSGSVARLYAATSSANSAVDTFYFRNSADSEYELEKFALTNESNTWTADQVFGGTTPQITIGDAGAEDTMLVFDGNAQDYRIGLDDGTDKLEIGVGAAHGTTTALTVDSSQQVTVVATTAASTATDGALYVAGGASVAGDVVVGDDLSLLSDSAVLNFGAGNDVTFTHDGGTGMDIVSAGSLDVSSTAGSVTMTVADGQTVTVGKSGASALLLSPHGTAGSELASLINTAGTTDGSDAAGAILLSSVAGGMGLAWADTKDLWAEGGSMMFVANEDKASCIQLHADAGTSQTIHVVNDAGTSVTEGAAAVQLLASAGGIGIKSTADLASAILITADGGTSETIKVHSDQGTGATSIELVSDAGGVSILAGNTTHGVKIATGTSGVPVTIGHSTSEVTVADNLTVSGNLTVTGTTITDTVEVISTSSGVLFEGGTDDGHEGTLISAVAGADVTYTLPNLTGHVPLLADAASNANVTAAEFALLDGGSSVGTTAVVDGDGILTNDGGTMKQTTVQTFQTYFDANSVGGGNMVTVGALNAGSITSGFGAIDNGTSGIRTATFTAETAFVPDAQDGAALGTNALQFSDLFLADGAVVSFGDDNEITLTHVADTGLTLTHTGAGDNLPVVLQLKSEEDAVIADEVIASIEFAAGDSDGTDAATVAAGIHAIAEETFGADANATKLVFTAADSETAAASATAKMTLASTGNLTTAGTITAVGSFIIGSADMSEADLEKLDGITNGTAAAAKALVLDGSKDVDGINALGIASMSSNWTNAGRTVADMGTVTTMDLNGGSIDGATIGAASAAAGTFTVVTGTSITGSHGFLLGDNLKMQFGTDEDTSISYDTNANALAISGSANAGTVVVGDVVPTHDSLFDLGSSSNQWAEIHADAGHIDALTATGTSTLTTVDINGGAIDGTTIGAASAAAGTFAALVGTSLSVSDGNITNVGDIALDTISADDGSSFSMGSNWTNASRTVADMGTVTTMDLNGGTIDGTTIGASSVAAGSFAAIVGTTGTYSGILKTDDATEATSTTDGSLQTDGGLSVAKSAVIGDDLDLLSDSAIINIGSTSKFTLTDQAANNCVMATSGHRLAFGNAGEYISGDGTDLYVISSGDIKLDPAGGDVDVDGNVVPNSDSADSLGSTSAQWANVYADKLGCHTATALSVSGSQGVAVNGGANSDGYALELANSATTGKARAYAWATYSSARLKKNIETIENPMDKVMQMRGVSYNWKSDGHQDVGFIAEEMGEVIPEVVHFGNDGRAQSIDYSRLTSVLVEAVKELKAEIEVLKNNK